jgi:hypothetical protein
MDYWSDPKCCGTENTVAVVKHELLWFFFTKMTMFCVTLDVATPKLIL